MLEFGLLMKQNHFYRNCREIVLLYKTLFNAKGWRLAYNYFLECHLFDILNKTDTHRMVPKESMRVKSSNFEKGQMYMVSWTSTVTNSLKYVKRNYELNDFKFVDIGCGKGKVVFLARKKAILGTNIDNYIGFDYDEELISTAKKNSKVMFGDESLFKVQDILKVDFELLGNHFLLFLYNPFDSEILEKFLANFRKQKLIVIYVNPVHGFVFEKLGFSRAKSVKGWHPNVESEIFYKL